MAPKLVFQEHPLLPCFKQQLYCFFKQQARLLRKTMPSTLHVIAKTWSNSWKSLLKTPNIKSFFIWWPPSSLHKTWLFSQNTPEIHYNKQDKQIKKCNGGFLLNNMLSRKTKARKRERKNFPRNHILAHRLLIWRILNSCSTMWKRLESDTYGKWRFWRIWNDVIFLYCFLIICGL